MGYAFDPPADPAQATATPRHPSAPKWLAQAPDAKDAILDRWRRRPQGAEPENPYTALQFWKDAVMSYSRDYFRELAQAKRKATNYATSLSCLLALYRRCIARPYVAQHVHAYLRIYPELTKLVEFNDDPNEPPNTIAIHKHITNTILDSNQHHRDPAAPAPDTLAEVAEDSASMALPPEPNQPSAERNHTTLDQLKGRVPTGRKGLHHLRSSAKSEPTSDPAAMGRIAQRAYGKIWAEDLDKPTCRALRRFLRAYRRTLSPADIAELTLPTAEDITLSIRDTNNSSPGPDGIPFAFYRLCADEVGPLLHDILGRLAQGQPPPPSFNQAVLFLLPKDESLLIDNTRPISVTNADNRIIAKFLATMLGPVLARVLHAMQKGFIPGRVGLDHIREINQRYYSALDRKHQYYILFLDTRKAFDSIHHDFIHATLRKLRVPQWICNVIAGLMAHVAVLPVFSRAHAIPIKRGVKQGCPLSPLLFAICYDVLLTALDKVPDHVSLAFADDLAAGAESLDTILAILRIINTFAKHSGLGLNIRKTTVLTTREPTATARGLLRLYWPRIKFVTSATYLGVIMGQEITTVDVFRKAMTKFLYRAQQMHMLIRSATLHQRITLYNTYLLPILCYLAQLFIVPYTQTVVPLREHCRKAIIPFNGTAFSYAHLVSPTRSMIGPFTPLRDLWATNMAFLAVRYDLAPSHGHELPQMGDMHHVTSPPGGPCSSRSTKPTRGSSSSRTTARGARPTRSTPPASPSPLRSRPGDAS